MVLCCVVCHSIMKGAVLCGVSLIMNVAALCSIMNVAVLCSIMNVAVLCGVSLYHECCYVV